MNIQCPKVDIYSRLERYIGAKNVNKLRTVCDKIQVWLRNRLISAGLEPILSHTEKACIASYYRLFPTNNEIKIIKLLSVLLAWVLGPIWANKTSFNLIIFILIASESYL